MNRVIEYQLTAELHAQRQVIQKLLNALYYVRDLLPEGGYARRAVEEAIAEADPTGAGRQ